MICGGIRGKEIGIGGCIGVGGPLAGACVARCLDRGFLCCSASGTTNAPGTGGRWGVVVGGFRVAIVVVVDILDLLWGVGGLLCLCVGGLGWGRGDFTTLCAVLLSAELAGALYTTGIAQSLGSERAFAPLGGLGGAALGATLDSIEDSTSKGKLRVIKDAIVFVAII